MAVPLIPLGIAAARAAAPAVGRLVGKGLAKLGKNKKTLTKKEKAEGPLADVKPRKKRKPSKKAMAARREANRKAQTRRGARRVASGVGSTAALGGAEALLTKKEEAKKVDKPKVDKPKASRPKPKTEGKTFKKPTVKTKTEQQRAEDASRKKVPVTRVSDAKATKRFVDKDKARKLKTPLQPPSSSKQKRIDARKENMDAAKKQSRKADVPMPTTVAAGQKRAEARGENRLAGTFKRAEQDKAAPGKDAKSTATAVGNKTTKFVDKAAVTREDLEAWKKRTGNEDLGYKESLRGLLNEARGLKRRGAKAGGTIKKQGFKQGGKVRGAGIATRGVRPTKMVKMKGS
jgi:hypothetical protein|tara:strand:+ start:3921 stop:4958 length:1038 start_codon:yes stop_codon:yes gene_type:complete